MKRNFGIIVLALLASSVLTAQNRVVGAAMDKGPFKELNLTEDQKNQLKVMHQGFSKQDSLAKAQLMKQREAVRAERRAELAKILTPEQLAQLDKLQAERSKKMKQLGKKQAFGAAAGPMQFRQGVEGRGQMRGQMHGQMRGQMGVQMGQMRGQMPAQMGPMRGQYRNVQANRLPKAPMVNPEIRIKQQVERMTKQLDLTPEQASKIQAIQEKHFKREIAKFRKMEKKRAAQLKKREANLNEIKAVLTPEQVKKMEALREKGAKAAGQGFQGPRHRVD